MIGDVEVMSPPVDQFAGSRCPFMVLMSCKVRICHRWGCDRDENRAALFSRVGDASCSYVVGISFVTITAFKAFHLWKLSDPDSRSLPPPCITHITLDK